jgi:hypothetical protein
MNPNASSFSASLIAQLPTDPQVAQLREQLLASIAADQKRAKRRRIFVNALWIGCAAASVYFAWFDPAMPRAFRGPFTAGFLLFWGAWEVLKERIKAARIEVLREIKQLQLQVLELSSRVPAGRPANTDSPSR